MSKLAEALNEKLQSWKIAVHEDDAEAEDMEMGKLDNILDRIESKPVQEQLRLYKGLFQTTLKTAKELPQAERLLKVAWREFWKVGFKK